MSSYIRLDVSTLKVRVTEGREIYNEAKEKFADREFKGFTDILDKMGFEYTFDEEELIYTIDYADCNELYEMEDIFDIIAKYINKDERMVLIISYLDFNERIKYVFYNGMCTKVSEIRQWADNMDCDF